ncbi:hypothetical protein M0812_20466 [Anaeramoeba flamelloides]|uniref:non-specific serine/threonine protein kinase n=1 Tax=Anaeramoeba flamelloides TaxID=1746091 RepID=A0AAV7YRX4_9EUKA|nr:hypothetical protein M0812_20466 [Anaeramoeba flamelloides]
MTTKPKSKPKQKQIQAESSSSEEEEASEYTKGGYHPVKTGEIFNRRFKAICKIGWGYFSIVWLAKDLRNGDFIALKVIKSEKTFAEAAEDEIELLKSVSKNDPYGKFKVVRLLDHFVHKGPNGNHICMAFELLDGATLLSLLKKYKYKGIPIKIIKDIIKQVLIALNFLHQKCKIIHTDLKPENVMIFKQVGSISEKLKEKIQKSGLKLEDIPKNKQKTKPNLKKKNPIKPKNNKNQKKIIQKKNNNRNAKKIFRTKNLKTPQPKKNQKKIIMKKRFLSQRKPQPLKKKKKITSNNSKTITTSRSKKINNTQKKRLTFKEKLGSLNKSILQLESELEKEIIEEFVELNDLPIFVNPFEIINFATSNNKANSETINQNKDMEQKSGHNDKEKNNNKGEEEEGRIEVNENDKDNEQNNKKENGIVNGNEKDNEKDSVKENENNNNNEEDKDKEGTINSEKEKKNENEKNINKKINSKNPRPKKKQRSLNCKIIDLGNACWIDKHFTEEIQTREYRSPEVILGHGYDKSADIWSLGCMFFELLTGDVLFQPTEGTDYSDDEDHLALIMELLGKIPKKILTTGSKSQLLADRNGNLKHIKNLEFWGLENVLFEKYKFSKKDTKEICDFLLPMFNYNMKKRITAQKLLNHSWLKINNHKRKINNRKK